MSGPRTDQSLGHVIIGSPVLDPRRGKLIFERLRKKEKAAAAIDRMKPLDLNLDDYNQLVDLYHNESDRSAALLAGSFFEHSLAGFIKGRLVNDPHVESLFHGFGPLATFSQRIEIAYAFALIPREARDEFVAIKSIRNHFAHNPKASDFAAAALDKHFASLAFATEKKFGPLPRRDAYLLTIGWYSVMFFIPAPKVPDHPELPM